MKIHPQHKSPEDRLAWLERITRYVKLGKIVEFGCGSGFVLEFLSSRYPESLKVGLDRSSERLHQVAAKHLHHVIPVRGDITRPSFRPGMFDTALFVGVLHEVYSNFGQAKVAAALRAAHSALDEEGVVIIQDFLKPSPRQVEVSFTTERARRKFVRFAQEFRPRRVTFKDLESRVKLDIADGVEFISKYGSPSEEDWREEMTETHFFFTEEDYQTVAPQAGFGIKAMERLPAGSAKISGLKEDIGFDFDLDYSWIQVVLVKRPV